MLATFMHGNGDIRAEYTEDPKILLPTDAIVEIEASCVCGSDLWGYRGVLPVDRPTAKGHEFLGTVTEVGSEVTSMKPGDFVIAPFTISCGECAHCRAGIFPSCIKRGMWGREGADGLVTGGGQAEAVRVPLADGTLFRTPRPDDASLIPHLLSLSDVMCTGHHAAICGNVRPGSTVVVVGDGAVGQCAVIAAKRLGAERIIMMSRHEDRAQLARSFGATDIVAERGADGAALIKELTGGVGADSVLECVGTEESFTQGLSSTRPGGQMGFVGLPAGKPNLPVNSIFARNAGVRGGGAPVLAYIGELLPDVMSGAIEPGRVFDKTYPLSDVAQAYADMDQRRTIKSLLTIR